MVFYRLAFLTELLRRDVEGYLRMVLLVVSEFELFSLET